MPHIHPTDEAITQVIADSQTRDEPIRMINLLSFRDVAEYAPGDPLPGPSDEPTSGADAYGAYAAVAFPEVKAVGGSQFYMATADQTLIGPESEDWDVVVIIEYPSRGAFLEMVSKPSYQAAVYHRTAALADSRLIMTTGF